MFPRTQVSTSTLSPSDFGVEAHALALCQGGSAAERAALLREILASGKKRKGETAAHAAVKDYIIINAAAAIFLARKADSYKAAADVARGVMEDGKVGVPPFPHFFLFFFTLLASPRRSEQTNK